MFVKVLDSSKYAQTTYGPFYSKWADKDCKKCNGSGVLSSVTPCWCPCSCMYKDEKYQPLYPEKDLIFTNESGSVNGYHYWTKHTDPLTMGEPYREHFVIEAKITFGQNAWSQGWASNQKLDAKDKEDLIDKCKKLSTKNFKLNIRNIYSDSGQSLDPKTETLSINFD